MEHSRLSPRETKFTASSKLVPCSEAVMLSTNLLLMSRVMISISSSFCLMAGMNLSEIFFISFSLLSLPKRILSTWKETFSTSISLSKSFFFELSNADGSSFVSSEYLTSTILSSMFPKIISATSISKLLGCWCKKVLCKIFSSVVWEMTSFSQVLNCRGEFSFIWRSKCSHFGTLASSLSQLLSFARKPPCFFAEFTPRTAVASVSQASNSCPNFSFIWTSPSSHSWSLTTVFFQLWLCAWKLTCSSAGFLPGTAGSTWWSTAPSNFLFGSRVSGPPSGEFSFWLIQNIPIMLCISQLFGFSFALSGIAFLAEASPIGSMSLTGVPCNEPTFSGSLRLFTFSFEAFVGSLTLVGV